jgi:DNA-binding CsgD family transcriptional regulator
MSVPTQEQITEVIHAVYGSATDHRPEAWQEILEQISVLFSSGPAALTSYSPETDRFDVIASTFSPQAVEAYNERFRYVSDMHASVTKLRPGEQFWRTRDHPDAEFLSSEIYHEFFKREGVYDLIYCVLFEQKGLMVGAVFSRPSPETAFDSGDIGLMTSVLPHLGNALRNCILLADLERDKQRMAETLSKVPRAILFLERSGKVAFANHAALNTLKTKDGLELDRNGRLFASLSKDEREFKSILASVFDGDGGPIPHDGVLPVSRPSGLRPLQLLLLPFSNEIESGVCGEKLALLVVYDPEINVGAVESVLSRMYDLTPAEAKVAVHIAKGRSPAEAAEHLAISQDTVRTHLKRIFHKTGTKRQSELITLIVNSPAALKEL